MSGRERRLTKFLACTSLCDTFAEEFHLPSGIAKHNRHCWVLVVEGADGVSVMCSMRWTVHGIPRVPWDAEGVFDGISTFKLDKDGKIYEHSVDNVLLQDPPSKKIPLFAGLNLIPSLQPQQQPCPGKFCLCALAVCPGSCISSGVLRIWVVVLPTSLRKTCHLLSTPVSSETDSA